MSGAAPPPAQPSAPLAGPVRYGRYILLDRLGVGGMAEVYRALAIGPEQFQRQVVVKRILPHLSQNEAFVKMFIVEATLCGRLSHPNIVHVHDFGRQDDQYFIAMEYVHGATVSATLRKLAQAGRRMPPTIAAEIARQTCLGLGYGHALVGEDGKPLGIIHRDITPANVMVSYTGVVKVLDFGIARAAGEAKAVITDAGQVKGKSSYLAPEQLKGGPIDGRVDIFAAGIVLHEMLTGRRLFKADSPLQTMQLIQSMEIPPPSKSHAAVPARLDEIVARALERDPDKRYAHAGDMAEELEALLLEQHYGSQEVKKFICTVFEGELAPRPLPSRDEIEVLMGGSEPVPVTTELSAPGLESRAHVLTQPGPETSARPSSRRKLWLGAAALVAAGGAVALFARDGERAPQTSEAAAPPPPPVAPSPPPAPATVRVTIASQPSNASVARQGAVLGKTPLSFELPRSSEPVDYRVSLPGFTPTQVQVVPDADRSLMVTLARQAPAASPPRPPARPARSAEGKVRNAVPIDPFK